MGDRWQSAALAALLVVTAGAGYLYADTTPPGHHDFALRDNIAYDGDTMYIEIRAPPEPLRTMLLRVRGVDTPELRGRCEAEIDKARAARDFVRALYAGTSTVRVIRPEWDKWGGRVLAEVRTPDGRDLARVLIDGGYGRAYDGGQRGGWCE
jgi:endonuclease YncB( thermonuclease family)